MLNWLVVITSLFFSTAGSMTRNDFPYSLFIFQAFLVFISNFQTGQLLKESNKETAHQKTVTSLTKSADGSHFLTGSLDKSAKVWHPLCTGLY